MSTNTSSNGTASIGPTLLLITFLVLKLTHVIDWPWVWVLAPAWVPLAIVVIFFAIVVIRAARGGRR